MLLKITASVYLDAPKGADPEDIATSFNAGARVALEDFPDAEVVEVDVLTIAKVSDAEADEKGLLE